MVTKGAQIVEAKKNIAKGVSYRLAYGMINSAIRHVFPLQAIAIEESILSDRLWAALNAGKTGGRKGETLGRALQSWKKLRDKGQSPFDAEMETLWLELTRWWNSRNKVIHGIVKSFHGNAPAICAENFDKVAMKVANKGKVLADTVLSWSHKQIRTTPMEADS